MATKYATMNTTSFKSKFQPKIVVNEGMVSCKVLRVSQPVASLSPITEEGDMDYIVNTNVITLTQDELHLVKNPNKSFEGSNLSSRQMDKVEFLRKLANLGEDDEITYEELNGVFAVINVAAVRNGEIVSYPEGAEPAKNATCTVMCNSYTSKAGNQSLVLDGNEAKFKTPVAREMNFNDLLGSRVPSEETPAQDAPEAKTENLF